MVEHELQGLRLAAAGILRRQHIPVGEDLVGLEVDKHVVQPAGKASVGAKLAQKLPVVIALVAENGQDLVRDRKQILP